MHAKMEQIELTLSLLPTHLMPCVLKLVHKTPLFFLITVADSNSIFCKMPSFPPSFNSPFAVRYA